MLNNSNGRPPRSGGPTSRNRTVASPPNRYRVVLGPPDPPRGCPLKADGSFTAAADKYIAALLSWIPTEQERYQLLALNQA